jgi:hypothetical protein
MLQLNVKYWNSTFNARSSSLIIVFLQLRVVKVYLTIVEAFKKKERQDET